MFFFLYCQCSARTKYLLKQRVFNDLTWDDFLFGKMNAGVIHATQEFATLFYQIS